MKSFIGVVIGGITLVVVTAALLYKHGGPAAQIIKGATHEYSRIATTFQNP